MDARDTFGSRAALCNVIAVGVVRQGEQRVENCERRMAERLGWRWSTWTLLQSSCEWMCGKVVNVEGVGLPLHSTR